MTAPLSNDDIRVEPTSGPTLAHRASIRLTLLQRIARGQDSLSDDEIIVERMEGHR